MNDPLIIEFCGLPGAGKTTVAKEVILSLRQKGIQCCAPDDEFRKNWVYPCRKPNTPVVWHKLSKRVKSAARTPSLAFLMYKIVWGLRPFKCSNLHKVDPLLREVSFLRWLNRHDEADIQVHDELFVHRLFSALFGTDFSRIKQQMPTLLKAVYGQFRHVLIFLDVDASTCAYRYSRRTAAQSRFNAETEAWVTRKLLRTPVYDMLRDAYVAAGFKWHSFACQDEPYEVAERIVDFIDSSRVG